MIAAYCHAGAYLGRYTIVVDDDIDVTKHQRCSLGADNPFQSPRSTSKSSAAVGAESLDPIIPMAQARAQFASRH